LTWLPGPDDSPGTVKFPINANMSLWGSLKRNVAACVNQEAATIIGAGEFVSNYDSVGMEALTSH
jgi:hypothetical protein